jgi:hypothetical protein
LLGSDPPPTVSTDNYTFTVFAMPTATATEPAMRPAMMGVTWVRDLDDSFLSQAIGTAVLKATSDAQPAMFATPPATM